MTHPDNAKITARELKLLRKLIKNGPMLEYAACRYMDSEQFTQAVEALTQKNFITRTPRRIQDSELLYMSLEVTDLGRERVRMTDAYKKARKRAKA